MGVMRCTIKGVLCRSVVDTLFATSNCPPFFLFLVFFTGVPFAGIKLVDVISAPALPSLHRFCFAPSVSLFCPVSLRPDAKGTRPSGIQGSVTVLMRFPRFKGVSFSLV